MRRTYIKNQVLIEWFGDELLKQIKDVKEHDEKEAADRIHRAVLAKVPVGSYRRSYRRTYTTMMGKTVRMKPWQQRLPGRLKSSIAKYKSKFQGGGYIVMAGNYLAWYARIVEYGTKMRRQKTTGRFTGRQKAERYLKRVLNAEKRRFINQVRQSMQTLRGMNQ